MVHKYGEDKDFIVMSPFLSPKKIVIVPIQEINYTSLDEVISDGISITAQCCLTIHFKGNKETKISEYLPFAVAEQKLNRIDRWKGEFEGYNKFMARRVDDLVNVLVQKFCFHTEKIVTSLKDISRSAQHMCNHTTTNKSEQTIGKKRAMQFGRDSIGRVVESEPKRICVRDKVLNDGV